VITLYRTSVVIRWLACHITQRGVSISVRRMEMPHYPGAGNNLFPAKRFLVVGYDEPALELNSPVPIARNCRCRHS
jgi:hypothetical protein